MKARKQISLEELFRLYPQLRQASHAQNKGESSGQDCDDGCVSDASAGQSGELAEA